MYPVYPEPVVSRIAVRKDWVTEGLETVIVRSLSVRIVTELTKAPNFAQ